jgi:uncharacterized protein
MRSYHEHHEWLERMQAMGVQPTLVKDQRWVTGEIGDPTWPTKVAVGGTGRDPRGDQGHTADVPPAGAAVGRRAGGHARARVSTRLIALTGMFADDIVWHQPGVNRFSGTHRGSAAVREMIGGMMTVSEGTFELALTAEPMINGALGAAPVRFAAKRAGAAMALDGVDLLRVDGGRIAEAWLFSADQQAEDAFWGAG